MKRLYLVSCLAFVACLSACSGKATHNNNPNKEAEITRLADRTDSLQQRINLLEEQNIYQESRIKDLESDLEDVINFLNRELNY